MSKDLFLYYDRELRFIREMAQEFARQYPGPAGRLLIQQDHIIDPHVERLIEAFALLTGRIQHKIDDEFPELTDALFNVLYPHYLAPIPSLAIVQFVLDPQRGEFPEGFRIERHSPLRTAPLKESLPCRYRTGYPVTLWPVALVEARLLTPPFPSFYRPPLGAKAALRLEFECQGPLPFTGLALDSLRLYLHGDNQVTGSLYELLLNRSRQVVFRPLDGDPRPEPIIINRPEECLRPVGFEEEEGLLPYPRTSFVGYRLLTEFFAFANKFLFIDLGGWERVRRAGFQRRLEVIVFLDRTVPAVEQAVDSQTFGLGCTPVVNLFAQTAEPIPLSQTRFEYRIVPDVAHPLGLEVYSVDSVTCLDPVTKRTTDYQPFYSFRHGDFAETKRAYWYAVRKPALGESDRGTEVYLQLVDLDFNPRQPAEATLVVGTTCTNRDLPTLLRQVGEDIYLELEMAAPLAQLRCLRAPTPTLRPPLRRGAYWRLISHLSLNHLSLTEGPQGALALQELLRLYDFSAPGIGEQMSRVVGQLIDGIAGIASRRVVGRTGAETSSGFCRGVEVTIEFDEEKYVGNNLFLFASILERFLGTYVTVNSFSQLVARTRHKQETLKKWPPRAGDRVLL